MSFLTYKETRPWAKAIKTAVLTKKMPPWFADPSVGHFSNERRLSETELNTIVKWVDGGAPEGDEKDRPAPATFADGWEIGKPDIVVEMANDVQIPATGLVDTHSVFVKVNFPEDVWVQAAEIRPGNRRVVHHMKAWVVYPATGPRTRASMGDGVGREILAKYNPGLDGQNFTVGDAAKFIPAGSDIMFETHYQSNGTPTTDRSKVGIVVSKTPPKNRFFTSGALTNHEFTVPAGADNFELKTEITVQEAVELTWVQPHMHMRGKDFEVRAVYPTGESETLLKVPHYNFEWQVGYEFAKPVPLPKGTRLLSIAHFDNSANNPFNPNPNIDVKYGAETTNEMSVGFFSVVIPAKANAAGLFKGQGGRRAVSQDIE
jgi:hypothetical protein